VTNANRTQVFLIAAIRRKSEWMRLFWIL
jgi:hypothetical protein